MQNAAYVSDNSSIGIKMIVQKIGTSPKPPTGGNRDRDSGDAAVGIDAVVRQTSPPPPPGTGKLIDKSA
jgi:hypothetical protein